MYSYVPPQYMNLCGDIAALFFSCVMSFICNNRLENKGALSEQNSKKFDDEEMVLLKEDGSDFIDGDIEKSDKLNSFWDRKDQINWVKTAISESLEVVRPHRESRSWILSMQT